MKRRILVMMCILTMAASSIFTLQAEETEQADAGKKSEVMDALFGEGGVTDKLFGEGGVTDTLFGEGGVLEDALPEGTSIGGMVSTLTDQLGKAGSEIAEVAGDTLGPLLGQLLGETDEFGDLDLDQIFEQSQNLDKAAEEFVLEMNADILENGDVQIVDPCYIGGDDIGSEEFKYLFYGMQYNYTEDDSHQLHPLCWKEDLILLTLHTEEDGSFTVLDAQTPDEQNYEASVEEFCRQVDQSPEDCMDTIEFAKAFFPNALSEYMKEHPEITGIEYEGAVRTAEELEMISFDSISGDDSPETETEADR